MPVRQSEKCVHAEQQAQRALRKFLAQLGQRVDGVGGARAAHFAIVDDERGLIGDRRAHHRQRAMQHPRACVRDAADCP